MPSTMCTRESPPPSPVDPSVVLPAHEVAKADVGRLRELLSAPATQVVGDWGRRHHVFVVTPQGVARQVAIGFDSGTWHGDGIDAPRPDAAVLEELRDICKRAGAPLSGLGTPVTERARERWWSQHRERTINGSYRRKTEPLHVDSSKTLATLDDTDKRRACLWNLEHLDTLFEPRPNHWMGHVSGTWTRVKSWRHCVVEFPSCGVAIGDITPCMEIAQKGDIWLARTDASRACSAQRDCMWGFAWAEGAEPPADE